MPIITISPEQHKLIKLFSSYNAITMEACIENIIKENKDLQEFLNQLKTIKL